MISLFKSKSKAGAPLMDARCRTTFAVCPPTPTIAIILVVIDKGSITDRIAHDVYKGNLIGMKRYCKAEGATMMSDTWSMSTLMTADV